MSISESTNSALPSAAMLAKQLAIALDANAVFCIGGGQPDEPELHDAARCPGCGGVLDLLPVANAIEVFDASYEALPDLDEHARALHCAILAAAVYFTPPANDAAVQAGFVLVPVEPTDQQRDAGISVDVGSVTQYPFRISVDEAAAVYRAMLAAAPKVASDTGAGQRPGEWDHRYRPLKHGEIIAATDECQRDDGTWITGICVGQPAPDPAYTSHRVYRRLIVASDTGAGGGFGGE